MSRRGLADVAVGAVAGGGRSSGRFLGPRAVALRWFVR